MAENICPICNKKHNIEIKNKKAKTIIKNEEIVYNEEYYFCPNASEDENEFVDGELLNKNLKTAKDEYRKLKNLLTSYEIVEIRKNYGLSQVELSNLLGWGEATISRYESKAIQDEAYDNILKLIRDNKLKAIEYLDNNKEKFKRERYEEIRKTLNNKLNNSGKEYLTREVLKSDYAVYNKKTIINGFTFLNIDKLECVISYLAKAMKVYKVKLAKLLWYADFISYKEQGFSVTGLVYAHCPMGALPVGHKSIMNLYNVIVEEKYVNEDVMYLFKENKKLDMSYLSEKEIEILDRIINKFKNYNTKEIVDYMHKEQAYINTKSNEIIPYSFAEQIENI